MLYSIQSHQNMFQCVNRVLHAGQRLDLMPTGGIHWQDCNSEHLPFTIWLHKSRTWPMLWQVYQQVWWRSFQLMHVLLFHALTQVT